MTTERDGVLERIEQDKYERMWAVPEYANFSPGVGMIPMFERLTGIKPGWSVLDIGCGSGAAAWDLVQRGYTVYMADITDAGLRDDVKGVIPFEQSAIWSVDTYATYGFCTDVFEHLPLQMTMVSAYHLLHNACEQLFLSICTEPDKFGQRIGETLHATVMPFVWWRDNFRSIAHVVEAIDLGATSVFLLEGK